MYELQSFSHDFTSARTNEYGQDISVISAGLGFSVNSVRVGTGGHTDSMRHTLLDGKWELVSEIEVGAVKTINQDSGYDAIRAIVLKNGGKMNSVVRRFRNITKNNTLGRSTKWEYQTDDNYFIVLFNEGGLEMYKAADDGLRRFRRV